MIALDERISAGMRAQLTSRREKLRAGDRPLGWKVGFGSPAAGARLDIDRPLVGFLLRSNLLPDGAEVPIGDWAAPTLEPEIAVHLAYDIAPEASGDAVRRAIGGLSAAIELADVDPPPTNVQKILAGNIFHRHVVLGPVRHGWTPPEDVHARVLVDGEEVAATDDVTALTGETVEVVRLTAELLELCGERLRARDVVITGSVVTPLPVVPGRTVAVELGVVGKVAVSLR
jgi:2-keto-4-pentenoate hydratase